MKKILPIFLAVLVVICAAYGINLKYDFYETAQTTLTTTAYSTEEQTEKPETQTKPTTVKRTVLQNVSSGGYSFRTQKLFDDHYKKHGDEFGSITKEEYLSGANALIANKNALQKTEDDGDKLFYLENSNEFAVLSSDGYIRTYFRPDSGIDYWNRQ